MFDHAEHAATVIERLEGTFGSVLTIADVDPPAGKEVVTIRPGPVANIRLPAYHQTVLIQITCSTWGRGL